MGIVILFVVWSFWGNHGMAQRIHKRKKGADDGGRDTSRPYLLQRKDYGGQRPLPPLILEGELVTIIVKSPGKLQRKALCP